MFSRTLPISLCIVVVIGAVARCYGISAKSLWLDEAMSWQMQRFSPGEIIERNAHHVGSHPPLYFVLLHCWTRAFGDSEVAMRLLAALAGIATIPAVSVMTRTLMVLPRTDRRLVCAQRASLGGLLAATLVALSPLHIHLSQQVRGYTLAVLLLVLSTIALLSALRASGGRAESKRSGARVLPRWRIGLMWSTFVVCAAGAAYLHYLAVVSVAILCALAVAYVFAAWRRARAAGSMAASGPPTPQGEALGRRGRGLAVALAALALAYSPWLPRLFSQSESWRSSWWTQKTASEVADTIFGALASTPVERVEPSGFLGWCTVAGVAAVSLIQWRSKSWGGKYLALAGTVPVAVLLGYSAISAHGLIESRYLVFAQLHWLCAAAATVPACRGMLVRMAAGIALAASSIGVCSDCWQELGRASNPDMRGAAAYVLERRQPDEMVVAQGSNVFFDLSYYLRGSATPLMAVAKHGRGGMFGLEHFADDDLITFAALAARRPAAIWMIESETFRQVASKNMAAPPGDEWETVERRSFVSDYNFEQPILVSYLRPRPKRDGP